MIKSIVVVGGGAAGWLTAGLIAARYRHGDKSPISVTLVESPNIPTIGVGEGTWPTMVGTLQRLGIAETEFIRKCNATLKQGSKFQRWVTGNADDSYYHPFTPPQGFDQISLAQAWLQGNQSQSFAHAVSLQAHLCDQKRAPKQVSSPDYATVENHGYHLDAGKFTELLTEHGTAQLGIRHVLADATQVNTDERGDITAITTRQAGNIAGDLFIDCTGSAALLIGRHYQVPFISKRDVMFIDRALAVQVPYAQENSDIESATLSTAQSNGWIWDIGLQTRRGVGHVFSSAHTDRDSAAQELESYIKAIAPGHAPGDFREIRFDPGFREKFWVNNCVAVGMAAGFLEPLEASALVMVELAANMIAMHLPPHRSAMNTVATRYNEITTFRWNRIIDFLKLHYVLSNRADSAFWKDNRDPASIPQSLQDLLALWRHQAPNNNGFLSPYDLFPAASYQYILYGMGFSTNPSHLETKPETVTLARDILHHVKERCRKVPPKLPSNRDYIKALLARNTENKLDLSKTPSSSCVVIPDAAIPVFSASCPLFFRSIPTTSRFECVALLGLSRNEQLLPPPQESAGTANITAQSTADLLAQADLLEPVSLDITLVDGRNIKVSGLYVINHEKLTPSIVARLEKANLTLQVKALQSSLKHVQTLIAKKNQLVRAAA